MDASDELAPMHIEVVNDTLRELNIMGKPVITVWNKIDLVREGGEKRIFRDFISDASVMISAATGEGIDNLAEELAKIIRESRVYVDRLIPYKEAAIAARIRREGQLVSEEYLEDGIRIRAYVPKSLEGILK